MEQQSIPEGDSALALEQFRRQWQEEVKSKAKQSTKPSDSTSRPATDRRLSTSRPERPINKPPAHHPLADVKDDNDEAPSATSALIERIEGLRVREVDEDDFSATGSQKEPQSALEHYEKAVERESQGNLGESVAHYRKAYRLDAKVDQSYRKKHFPTKPKPTSVNPSNASETVPNTAHHSSKEPDAPLPFPDLIASFATLSIPNAEPVIEGTEPPPCYINKLPVEVLIELLRFVAVRDPSDFVRLALVCKKLAFHVFNESAIWKRVATGPEFGLASQQYQFSTDVQGRPAIFQTLEKDEDENGESQGPVDGTLFSVDTDWRDFFHNHPRIRFTGVYISTVNYTRAGGSSATISTWTSQVHIVTYYRYLRFFRDGTVISLLTVSEPRDVVHLLTRENVSLIRGGKDAAHPLNFTSSAHALTHSSKEIEKLPPTARDLMKHALRGRWRLCHPLLTDPSSGTEVGANIGTAGDLHIETEGAGPRYLYTMHLSLKSSSRSKHTTKNNKLIWKGFWSYNQLTDDWSEFHLRNDKAFYFSRVKAYGLGY